MKIRYRLTGLFFAGIGIAGVFLLRNGANSASDTSLEGAPSLVDQTSVETHDKGKVAESQRRPAPVITPELAKLEFYNSITRQRIEGEVQRVVSLAEFQDYEANRKVAIDAMQRLTQPLYVSGGDYDAGCEFVEHEPKPERFERWGWVVDSPGYCTRLEQSSEELQKVYMSPEGFAEVRVRGTGVGAGGLNLTLMAESRAHSYDLARIQSTKVQSPDEVIFTVSGPIGRGVTAIAWGEKWLGGRKTLKLAPGVEPARPFAIDLDCLGGVAGVVRGLERDPDAEVKIKLISENPKAQFLLWADVGEGDHFEFNEVPEGEFRLELFSSGEPIKVETPIATATCGTKVQIEVVVADLDTELVVRVESAEIFAESYWSMSANFANTGKPTHLQFVPLKSGETKHFEMNPGQYELLLFVSGSSSSQPSARILCEVPGDLAVFDTRAQFGEVALPLSEGLPAFAQTKLIDPQSKRSQLEWKLLRPVASEDGLWSVWPQVPCGEYEWMLTGAECIRLQHVVVLPGQRVELEKLSAIEQALHVRIKHVDGSDVPGQVRVYSGAGGWVRKSHESIAYRPGGEGAKVVVREWPLSISAETEQAWEASDIVPVTPEMLKSGRVDLVVKALVEVEVTVQDASGPREGEKARVRTSGMNKRFALPGSLWEGVTDTKGSATLGPLVPGAYLIGVEGESVAWNINLEQSGGGVVPVVLRLPTIESSTAQTPNASFADVRWLVCGSGGASQTWHTSARRDSFGILHWAAPSRPNLGLAYGRDAQEIWLLNRLDADGKQYAASECTEVVRIELGEAETTSDVGWTAHLTQFAGFAPKGSGLPLSVQVLQDRALLIKGVPGGYPIEITLSSAMRTKKFRFTPEPGKQHRVTWL